MTKKFLALLLATVMICSLGVIPVSAADSDVASWNGTGYTTLQAAIDAATAVEGTHTIELQSGVTIDEPSINIHQTKNVNLTIKGNGTDTVFTGHIEIYGHARYTGTETLTFDGILFETAESDHVFIEQTAQTGKPTSGEKCYPHNVTVQNCSFKATGAAQYTAVGMKYRYGYNITVKNTTGDSLHSLMQNYAGKGLTIEDVTIQNGKNGIALGTSQNVTVNNANITGIGYGLRSDAGNETTVTIQDCAIETFIPVVVRDVTTTTPDINLVFEGSNTMTATNDDGVWCAIGAEEYDEETPLPTTSVTTVSVTLNDTSLETDGLHGVETENITIPEPPSYPTPKTWRVVFVADGRMVAIVKYRARQTELTFLPKVPKKEGYVGEWETYELNKTNLIVHAVYTEIVE